MAKEEERWRVTGILVAVLLASISAGLIRPSLALLLKVNLQATVIAVSSLTSGFMAGRATMSLVAGFIGDVSPEKRRLLTIIPLLTASAVIYTATYSASSIALILAMTLWGALAGLTWPTAQTLIVDATRGKPGTFLSLYFATGTLGVAVGGYLFGILPLSFYSMARIGTFLLALSGIILWTSSIGIAPSAGKRMKLRETTRILDRRVGWILYSAFTAGFLTGLLREYFYVYVYEEFHIDKSGLGSLLAIGSIAALIGGLTVGPLSDRIGVPKTLVLTLILATIGGTLLSLDGLFIITALGFIFALTAGRSTLPLTRNAALLGVGRGGSTMVGLSNTLSNLGNMVSPLIAGTIYTYNISILGVKPGATTFFVATIMVILDVILYIILFGERKSNP
ncbi:MAG: MFS transporter [Desulfurococcales archaeon]|nr:MFS transporter [Desulfurococcales archaeon]